MKIPICDLKAQHQSLRDEIGAAIDQVLESGAFILGPQVKELENQVSRYCGVSFGVGVASGTDAITLALEAAGIGPGDEVVTTPFTFIATASAISRCGAKPIFVDIDPLTYNISPAQIEHHITPRTRAILPVHLYGQCCDMDAITDLASKHNLLIIEDAAQAIGARWNGRPVGTFGSAAALSFFPSKNLGAYGDGGMVVTNHSEISQKVDMLRRQGSRIKYHSECVGLNSRLDTIQAAILLVKLKHLDQWITQRQVAAQLYKELLKDTPLQLPHIDDRAHHVFHQFTIATPDRDALASHLTAAGIGTMVYYPVPVHLQAVYSELNMSPGSLPAAEKAASSVLSLPMFPEITQEQIHSVCGAILDFFGK